VAVVAAMWILVKRAWPGHLERDANPGQEEPER
jgi:hypothetical protein